MRNKNSTKPPSNQSFWAKLSLGSLRFWPASLLVWLLVLLAGICIYTNVIAREGFPDINTPIVVINAAHFNNDALLTDKEIAEPLNDILNQIKDVTYIETISSNEGVNSFVSFKGNTEDQANKLKIQQALEANQDKLPEGLEFKINNLEAAGFLGKYDLLLTVYDESKQSDLKQIQNVAEFVAENLKSKRGIKDSQAISLIINDPQRQIERQIGFNQIGLSEQSELNFYSAIHVGIIRDAEEIDTLDLSDLVEQELNELDLSSFGEEFKTSIIEDIAEAVQDNISRLESNLLTGLIIISLVSFLLISWRSSIVVALFMFSVLTTSILSLYVIGYSLNLVILFALILALGLIVDDAIIMVEALDTSKNRKLPLRQTVKLALDKILLASLSGTLTTIMVFIPLAFVDGVLGELIRFIPITLLLALLISFLFSITLIPVLAKFSILKEKRSSRFKRLNPFLKLEDYLSNKIANLPLLLKTRPRLGKTVMFSVLSLSLIFIISSFSLFGKLSVNIFPPLEDSEFISYSVEFPADYDLAKAEAVAEEINKIVSENLSSKAKRVNYTFRSIANQRQMQVRIILKPLSEREDTSHILTARLQAALDKSIVEEVDIFVSQTNAGPPAIQYPFSLPIVAENETQAQNLAQEIEDYLTGPAAPVLKQPNGEIISIKRTRIQPGPNQISRLNDQRIISFEIQYDQLSVNDTVLNETESQIKKYFDSDYLSANSYGTDILAVEVPQTSLEESFNSLYYIFPLALILTYALLFWQFKSWFQPFIIFIALPFALTGVVSWLYLSQTPLSFLVFVGLISLTGIAVNNTILLVSYANFALKEKASPIEAISQALKEHFRPLIITTLTTALALLPLALNDVFWQDLAWTIIWGLTSSTILILLVFPYCYLGAVNLVAKLSEKKKKL